MANIYSMVDTWNEGSTTFTAIKMNVTDTASASDSLLMDLQIGGTGRFSVAKGVSVGNGCVVYLGTGAVNGVITNNNSTGLRFAWGNTNLTMDSNGVSVSTSGITYLATDAANTLAQRNSTNAQTFNLYNTYTDASNYERGFMKWISGSLEIGTERDGTGLTRNVFVRVGGTRSAIFSNTYVQFDVDFYPTQNIIMAAKYTEMAEMAAPAAPAANKVRIYAEDDGAGKTRLMALFPTGAAQQIAIEP